MNPAKNLSAFTLCLASACVLIGSALAFAPDELHRHETSPVNDNRCAVTRGIAPSITPNGTG
jgi:hypothetical protein